MAYRKVTRFVEAADGTPIAYHIHLGETDEEQKLAQRPAVVLSNGIGTTENFWRHLVADLQRDYRVVHWDYRGHGGSGPGASRDYGMPVLADDLSRVTTEVMKLSGGPPPVQVGFSMGVAVLMELYRVHPSKVRALALIAGAPDAPGTGTLAFRIPGVLRAVRLTLAAAQPLLPIAAPGLRALLRSRAVFPAARALGLIQKHAPREDIDEFTRGVASMDPKVFWRMARCLMQAEASDVLPTLRVPVLIVAAGRDEMMPRVQVEQMRAALPTARYVEVPLAGHAGLVEEGPAIAQPLRDWLTHLEGGLLTGGDRPGGVGRPPR